MNRLEIRTRSRNLLDELSETPGESHWDSDRLDIFIEEGKDDAVGRCPSSTFPKLWSQSKQHLSSGVVEYNLPTNMCYPIEFFVYGKRARPIPLAMESVLSDNPMWTPSQSDPYVIYPYSEGKVKISPAPTTLVINGFITHFLRLTVPLTSDSSIPELPYNMHEWLVDYVVWRALAEDGDPRAKEWKEIYEGHFSGGG